MGNKYSGMQLEIYNPSEYMYWNKHKLKPQEHPIESCNFTIYNFGPAARVAIACVDSFTDPHMQTFVVYPGRNLLCPCRLKNCYINGNEYSKGHTHTYGKWEGVQNELAIIPRGT